VGRSWKSLGKVLEKSWKSLGKVLELRWKLLKKENGWRLETGELEGILGIGVRNPFIAVSGLLVVFAFCPSPRRKPR
jgi:hypothetical protein